MTIRVIVLIAIWAVWSVNKTIEGYCEEGGFFDIPVIDIPLAFVLSALSRFPIIGILFLIFC